MNEVVVSPSETVSPGLSVGEELRRSLGVLPCKVDCPEKKLYSYARGGGATIFDFFCDFLASHVVGGNKFPMR